MPAPRHSKGFLIQQREQLSLYRRLLPSLELKRRQLMVELATERRVAKDQERALTAIDEIVGAQLPMLQETELPLDGLVQVEGVTYGVENLVGVRLPVLGEVQIRTAPYGLLTRPAWVDVLVLWMHRAVRAQLSALVARVRVARLEAAVRRMSQRVNLFERVLIPRAEDNIRRARIFLGDQERAAVVRAKLAKARASRAGWGA